MPSPDDQGVGVPAQPVSEDLGLRRVREVEHAARRSKEAASPETASASSVSGGGVSLWVETLPAGAILHSGRLVRDVARCRVGGPSGPDLLEGRDELADELAAALNSANEDQAAIASVFLRAAVLCLAKNRDYSSSFRAPSRLAPHVSAQDRLLARIDDKDLRFINLGADSSGDVGESRLETMRDRACYSLLWCLLEEERLGGGGGE